jgi:ABC-type transport system substrate-binding protein
MNRQILNMKSMFVIYMCLLAAISLSVSSMASNSAFAQGTTESDAAAGEEAQSTSDPLELISTIQSLLNQSVVEYSNQNFTGAAELAQIAYLDNYEYLEAPLGQLDPALMEATEIMIREDMQNSIESRVPLSELQQLVNTIDGNLITAQQLFS